MKQIIFLFYFLFKNSLYCQECTPSIFNFSIDLSQQEVSSLNIKNQISKKDTTFSQDVVNLEWNRLLKCNDEFKKELDKIEVEIKKYSELQKELFIYQDLDALNKQLKDSRDNIEKVKNEVKKESSKVERKGLFAVLIKNLPNIPPSTATLIEKANRILAPFAIEQINGTYIKRLTTAGNYLKVNDAIEAMSNGNMKQVFNYSNTPNLEKKYFLYIVEVSVTPASNSINTYLSDNNTTSKVFFLNNNSDWLNQLQNEEVDKDDIEKVAYTIKERVSSIVAENLYIETKHKEELIKSNLNIDQIEREIIEINLKISNRSKKIEDICKKIKTQFINGDPNTSASNAKRIIDSSIIKLTNNWNDTKEKEFFYKEVPVLQLNNPKEDLSRNILELYELINREQGTIEGVELYNKIENSIIKENITRQSVSVYRQIDKLWIALMVVNKRFYKIGFFAKFKITNERTLTIEEKDLIKRKKETEEYEYKRKLEIEKKKMELKAKRKKILLNTLEISKDLILAADLLSLKYQLDTNYQRVNLGLGWGKFENEYALFGGISAGKYWGNNKERGLVLTSNFTYIKKTPNIIAYLGYEDDEIKISSYYSIDACVGIGKGSFISLEPYVGVCFNKKAIYFLAVGVEFRNKFSTRLGLHAGINFIFNDDYKSHFRDE